MKVDYNKVQATRQNAIQEFDNYVRDKGYPEEDDLFSLSVTITVGYFLKVHSKDPESAVRKYLKEHSISYRKANEIKMLINILK